MIDFPVTLKTSGAHSGIAPVHLLDVLDVNNNAYYWSDRPVKAPIALAQPAPAPGSPGFPLTVPVELTAGQFAAWFYPTVGAAVGNASFAIAGSACSGHVHMDIQGPFTTANKVTFSDFLPDILPAGAVLRDSFIVVNHGPLPSDGYGGFAESAGYAGQSSLHCGSGPQSAVFQLWNTLPPQGAPDVADFVINSIALCRIYDLPSGGGGGGGVTIFNPEGFSVGPYLPWILSVPKIVFNRSLATDFGSFILQNLSGDTLARDWEKIARKSALEGAFFIYRLWQPDVRASWIEVHGTLTVEGIPTDTVTLKGTQLINPAQVDAPAKQYCETCQQVIWGGPGCGATGPTECQYSFQTCQVPERFLGSLNSYEKNYGEALVNTALKVINRQRRI